eukprot:TRINITY_DN5001_c0_g3_i2.p1 TRINITY_DN5001_c0_g3~~TRINITY_DN5001_c0_g3_i2.p1  ORF type:complete len:1029 (+),score=320.34 TRINITY_DN5001_c0_g3_i2:85-3087(+)
MEVESGVRKTGPGETSKVKVMVRVRPFVSRELAGLEPAEYPVSVVQMDGNCVTADGYKFDFHEAFWSIPDSQMQPSTKAFADQEAVFTSTGLPAVGHALSGYHSCIFAYGQTGSGKTHSMLGSGDDPGVAPRLVHELFERMDAQDERRLTKGFRHQVEISFFEIYNEQVKDLFAVDDKAASTARRHGSFMQQAPRRVQSIRYERSPGRRRGSTIVSRTDSLEIRKRPAARTETPPPRPTRLDTPAHSPAPEPDAKDGGASEAKSEEARPAAAADGEKEAKPAESKKQRRSSKDWSFELIQVPRRTNSSQPPSPRLGASQAPSGIGRRGSRQVLAEEEYRDLRVRHSPQSGTFVEGLRRLGVADGITGAASVVRHMRAGMQLRATAETGMNSTSSRSHAIFQICVKSRNQVSGVQRYAHINLVDLAGSERVKMSQAEGERFVETTRINLSLLTLRRVIDVLIDNTSRKRRGKEAPVPWRDSMLTRVLSDSLGGNSRTVMFATVSPAKDCREDTINTLKYAHKAKDIVNTVYVNEQKTSVVMSLMQRELAELKQRLREEEAKGESAQIRVLTEEISEKDREYRAAVAELESAKISYLEAEQSVRDCEDRVATRSEEVEQLRREKVEEKHQEERDQADRFQSDLRTTQERIVHQRRLMETLGQQQAEERENVQLLDQRQREAADRELAFRQEMLAVKRKRFILAFHRAFKDEAREGRIGRHGAELEAIGQRERQALGDLSAASDRLSALRGEVSGFKAKVLHAERSLTTVDQSYAAEERRLQETVRNRRAAVCALEHQLASAADAATRCEVELERAQRRRARAADAQAEQMNRAQLKLQTAATELDTKRSLVEQLQLQRAALRKEAELISGHVSLFRDAHSKMQQEAAELDSGSKRLAAERQDLERWLAAHGALVRAGRVAVDELRTRSVAGRTEVANVQRNHDDLRTFVSQRFFPTGEAPEKRPRQPRRESPDRELSRNLSRSPHRLRSPARASVSGPRART